MQIMVVNKRDKKSYWLNKYKLITNKYNNAATYTDLNKISKIIKSYRMQFNVYVLTLDGEIVSKYE
jgi:hypothetical protein